MAKNTTKIDLKDQFIELRAKEVPYEKIANELSVSKPTLIKWGKDFKMEISNRRALELDYLQNKYYVTAKRRIEAYGEQLRRLDDEIVKRDLSDVPTEKLIDLRIKTIGYLKQEEMKISFKEESTFEETLDVLTKSYTEWDA